MQQTPNYALKKIELADSPPDITVINPNWDLIDQKMKDLEETDATHLAENAIDAHNASNISVVDATGLFVSADVEGALKEAIEKANSAFTSASNGKVQVRNAITGKGGTVADADGDGIPTFTELADGVNGISQGGMSIPNNTNFNDNRYITAVDDTGKIYVTEIFNSVWVGAIYTSDMVLIERKTDVSSRPIRSISPEGYVVEVNTSSAEIYNLSGTLVATINLSRVSQDISALRSNHLAFWAPFDNIMKIVNFAGTQLYSISHPIRPSLFRNKKKNLVFITTSGGAPYKAHRYNEQSVMTVINGIGTNYACFDFQNW